MKTLVELTFGSHLYGTNTPESDSDVKAVHLEDLDNFLLNKTKSVITYSRSKKLNEKNNSTDTDYESFELNRFASLAKEGQTAIFDMLFSPSKFWLKTTPEWETLVENRNLFLTKQPAKFVGYCRAQASKFSVKGERVAAAKAASDFFSNLVDMGFGKDKLKIHNNAIMRWAMSFQNQNSFVTVHIPFDGSELMVDVCGRKCQWGNTIQGAFHMYDSLFKEYGNRAKLAMDNHADWKALSHAVRIANEAIELLIDHSLTFPRPEYKLLLDIKTGKLPYNKVSEMIEELLEEVEKSIKLSTLPQTVDNEKIDSLVLELYHKNIFT